MKKFFDKSFSASKEDKISDKTMLKRIFSTIAIVVACLISMCFSAYAYFTSNVTSTSNKIQTATFSASIVVENADATTKNAKSQDSVSITNTPEGIKIQGLEIDKWYNIIITPAKTNTAKTGYMILSATSCKSTYHTQQLGVDKNANDEYTPQITFKVMVTDTTDLILKPCWGTSVYYQNQKANNQRYITQNEEITLVINNLEPNLNSSNTNTTDTEQNTTSQNSSNTNVSSNEESTDSYITSTSSNLDSESNTQTSSDETLVTSTPLNAE